MNPIAQTDRCRWCDEPLPPKEKPGGRRREFCGVACRDRLHGRRRWLRESERPRLEAELSWRRRAVEGSPHPAGAARWVESLEQRLARVDDELAALEAK